MVLVVAIIVGVAVFCFLHGYIAAAIVCLFGFSKRYGWPALLITSTFLLWERHWFVASLPPLLIVWNIWGLKYLAGGTSQAAVRLRKVAEQGDAEAQFSLGDLHYNGQGVPKDYAQAAFWFLKAAEQGNAGAQFLLGFQYMWGLGVPKDYPEAYFWYDLAAVGEGRLRAREAAKHRDEAASHLTPADLSRAEERARKWFEEHQAKPQ
jgi:hypothetical protein